MNTECSNLIAIITPEMTPEQSLEEIALANVMAFGKDSEFWTEERQSVVIDRIIARKQEEYRVLAARLEKKFMKANNR